MLEKQTRSHRKNIYRKFPKYLDTQTICCNRSKILTMWLHHRVMSPNNADGMANSVDPDQTAPLGAVWSGSALLPRLSVPKLRSITVWVSDLLSWFLFCFRVIVYYLEMIWMCGLNSNKVTKSLNFCWREIPIIVFGLHVHNHKKWPNLTLF